MSRIWAQYCFLVRWDPKTQALDPGERAAELANRIINRARKRVIKVSTNSSCQRWRDRLSLKRFIRKD